MGVVLYFSHDDEWKEGPNPILLHHAATCTPDAAVKAAACRPTNCDGGHGHFPVEGGRKEKGKKTERPPSISSLSHIEMCGIALCARWVENAYRSPEIYIHHFYRPSYRPGMFLSSSPLFSPPSLFSS